MGPLFMSAVALALGVTAPASDKNSATSATQEKSPGAETEQLFQQYFSDLYGRRFDRALATAGQFHPDAANREGRAIVDAMRASALLGLKREKEAQRLISEIKTMTPQQPFPATTLFQGGILADRYDIAADAFDELIARFPDVAREQDQKLVGFFLRNEPKGQDSRNDDRRIALARLGYGGDDGDWIASSAVDILMRRGDAAAASGILQYVDETRLIEDMLVQKRYGALWPRLEQLAGPHLENTRASLVAAAEKAYAAAPDDHERLAKYVNALRHAGRLDEAIALKAKVPQTAIAMGDADEQMGWTVNNIALALHAANRAEEADKLFAMLNDATMRKEYWRISTKINRLELLVTDGKFNQALPLIEPTARTEGSPYADQLVRRLRYCTLARLDRKADADKYLPDVLSHAADAPGPTIDGLLCAGEIDKAEQVALTALKNADVRKRLGFEEEFVRSLQPVALTSDDPSVWQERWGELRKRLAIAREYDRLGRDMPAEYLPPKAK